VAPTARENLPALHEVHTDEPVLGS
jgi:hypothetical protein